MPRRKSIASVALGASSDNGAYIRCGCLITTAKALTHAKFFCSTMVDGAR